jgi:hypothetical protein
MKHTSVSLPEVGLIAATRGMLGAGVGLLAASKLRRRRRPVGKILLAIGAISTIPIVLNLLRKDRWS